MQPLIAEAKQLETLLTAAVTKDSNASVFFLTGLNALVLQIRLRCCDRVSRRKMVKCKLGREGSPPLPRRYCTAAPL